ncbi:NADPH-dependent F420 reductase [Halomarina salina]|uniref:NADPH-dependent F420 reductase n=1 Tax=Halomarina salina TaxID=1872699 RepID=A0ABD5RSL0_9EURY
MDIGIVGAGRLGETLARLFVDAGHEVMLSNSRGAWSVEDQTDELGRHAHPGDVEEAVLSGEVVVLALPFRNRESLPSGDLFAGKIVVDATNPYTESGEVMDLPRPSSEYVARQFPGARVVKAFNTLDWETLRDAADPTGDDRPDDGRVADDRLAVFVAGDYPNANETVADLVEDVGFAPVETGTLAEGSTRQEPGGELYGRPMAAGDARKRIPAGRN